MLKLFIFISYYGHFQHYFLFTFYSFVIITQLFFKYTRNKNRISDRITTLGDQIPSEEI